MSKLLHYIGSIQPGVWGDEEQHDINDVECVRVADFEYATLSFHQPETVRNVASRSRYFLKKGDILIEKSGGGEKTTVGRAVYSHRDIEVVYANFIDRLRPKNKTHGKFIAYFLAHLYSIAVNTKYIKQNTGIQNLDLRSYLREEVEFPPEEKWIEIADFLDHKVAKIDEAIAKKKKLLKLLEEKRTSVITAATSASGNRKKLKRLARNIVTKRQPEGRIYMLDNIESWTGKVLGSTDPEDVAGEVVSFSKYNLLFGKLRPYLAKVMLAEEEGSCSGEFLVLKPSNDIVPRYLFYRMVSHDFIDQVNSATFGAKMPRANWEVVGSIEISVPSIDEQNKIVKRLDSLCRSTEKASKQIQGSIKLLEEYKNSLISNAVLGRVKV